VGAVLAASQSAEGPTFAELLILLDAGESHTAPQLNGPRLSGLGAMESGPRNRAVYGRSKTTARGFTGGMGSAGAPLQPIQNR